MTGPEKRVLAPVVDTPAVVAKAAALLRAAGVDEFALVGGAAVRAFGFERTTKNVDFAVRRAAIPKVLATFSGPVRELPIGGVSLELPEGQVVDLIDRRQDLEAFFIEALEATRRCRTLVDAAGVEVPVIPSEYLVVMKLAAGRPQDEVDIGYLFANIDLDYAETRRIARRHLGLFAVTYLDRLARRAGRSDVPAGYGSRDS